MVAIPNAVNIVLIVLCAISAVIAGAAHCIMADWANELDGLGIRTGGNPGHYGKPGEKGKTENLTSYIFLFALVMAIVLFALAIMEIVLLFISVDWLSFLKKGFFLPILYICLGVMSLSAAGDLGIAGGSLLIIFGAIRLILSIVGGGGK